MPGIWEDFTSYASNKQTNKKTMFTLDIITSSEIAREEKNRAKKKQNTARLTVNNVYWHKHYTTTQVNQINARINI